MNRINQGDVREYLNDEGSHFSPEFIKKMIKEYRDSL